jgi:hypothetical protein
MPAFAFFGQCAAIFVIAAENFPAGAAGERFRIGISGFYRRPFDSRDYFVKRPYYFPVFIGKQRGRYDIHSYNERTFEGLLQFAKSQRSCVIRGAVVRKPVVFTSAVTAKTRQKVFDHYIASGDYTGGTCTQRMRQPDQFFEIGT